MTGADERGDDRTRCARWLHRRWTAAGVVALVVLGGLGAAAASSRLGDGSGTGSGSAGATGSANGGTVVVVRPGSGGTSPARPAAPRPSTSAASGQSGRGGTSPTGGPGTSGTGQGVIPPGLGASIAGGACSFIIAAGGSCPTTTAPPAQPAAAPAPAISGQVVAQMAMAQLQLHPAAIHTAPPAATRQIVGIDTWLWADPADWTPHTATASVGALSAQITATPITVTWATGDGTTIDCHGPGTPWQPGAGDTDCKHVYDTVGTMHGSASVTWQLQWAASDGTGGTLPSPVLSTPVTLQVAQVQATTT